MKILLIDTCGAQASVAFADTSSEPASVVSVTLPGRSASEKLVGAVRELINQSRHPSQEEVGWGTRLDAIAVVNGPGSFTGVRVGLSAAKGLGEALSVPLIAISRLAVLASMAQAMLGIPVFAALDAGRGEFYLGEYRDGAEVHEALVTREELVALFRAAAAERTPVVCEESVALALKELRPRLVAEPDAAAALPLAMRRLASEDFDDVASVDANYLRRTDLEIFAKMKTRAGEGETAR